MTQTGLSLIPKIRQRLIELEIGSREYSIRLGLGRATIQRILQGRNIRTSTFERIVDDLQLTLALEHKNA